MKSLSIPILLFILAAFSTSVFAQIEEETELRFSGFAFTDAGLPAEGAQVCALNKTATGKTPFSNCALTESDGSFSVVFRKRKGDRFNLYATTNPNGGSGQETFGAVPALRIVNNEPEDADLAETEIKLGFKTQVVNGEFKPKPPTSTEITIEVCRLDAPFVCKVQKHTWTPGMPHRPYEISTAAAPYTFRFRFERDEWGEWVAVAKNNRTAKRLRVETDADAGQSIKVSVIK